jgi:hypothetical protein
LAQQRGGEGMTREHSSQEDGESPSATPALAAIGTKDPLAPGRAAVECGGIVAVEQTVPV